tara:strand:+ start:3568 stop:4230 length:663 start_codon:yes stop_codon:yes gene_type:complete
MRLLIKFPTRNRPRKFLSTLIKYNNKMVDKNNIVVSIDNDDETMKEPYVMEFLNELDHVTVCSGDNKTKIEAINADVPEEGWDILLLASDDMIPIINGFDTIIKEKMLENFPDTDGVLWFNDGYQGNKLNTLSIIGKKYYDRFKYIYNPEYIACWCDNEFTKVGNLLNRQKYFEETIIRHEHPDYGYGKMDYAHQMNVKYYYSDMDIFNRRQLNNFNLDL